MIIDSPIISGSTAATGSLNQVGNVVITGSLTVTGPINGALTGSVDSASFSQTSISASYASNAELLDGLNSTVFTQTGSFNTFSSSQFQIEVSQSQQISASFATASAYSASLQISILAVSNSVSTSTGNTTTLSASIYQTDTTQSFQIGANAATASGFSARLSTTITNNSASTFQKDATQSFQITANALTASNSLTSLSQSLYFTDTTQSVNIASNSSSIGLLQTFSGSQYKNDSSSFDSRILAITGSSIDTGSFATTGSNNFVGDQTITGSFKVTYVGNTGNPTIEANSTQVRIFNPSASPLEISNLSGDVYITAGGGNPYKDLQVTAGILQPSSSTYQSQNFLQTTKIYGSLTASLQEGYAWVGGAGDVSVLVATSSFGGGSINTGSFATTGSNAFFGTNTFSGAVAFTGSAPTILSSSFSGSIITNLTDTYTDVSAVNQIVTLTSASYAALASGSLTNPNTLYIVSGSTSGSITGATLGSNTFSGSQIFTGSVQGNVVSMSIASNTASMDLNLGNYFTLTLAGTATTHISASNVQPGVSATLVITTGTNSSASLAPTMLQPSGSAYSATNGSAKKDVLSIVAVASGVPFVVSTKNMI